MPRKLEDGLYSSSLRLLALKDGEDHFLTAAVQMIDPARARNKMALDRAVSLWKSSLIPSRPLSSLVCPASALTDGLDAGSDSGVPGTQNASTYTDLRITNVTTPTFLGHRGSQCDHPGLRGRQQQ